MQKAYKRFYIWSLAGLIAASGYPLYMGITTLWRYIRDGVIAAENYQKYIIPYTPICMALIVTVALLPLLFRWCKRFTLPIASALGALLFLAAELAFEQIKIVGTFWSFGSNEFMTLEAWQTSLCYAQMQTEKTVDLTDFAMRNPAFKLHFYIIALVIVLTVISVFYGFSKMIRTADYRKLKPLVAQAVSVLVFIGLCIWACFTAFYRTGLLTVSPLSAVLMTIFFLTFGITFGVYAGGLLYGKRRWLAVGVPSVVAMATTLVMYIGELILLNGELYKLGKGWLFEPMGASVFAAFDILVILAAGGLTCGVTWLLNRTPKAVSSSMSS